MARPLKESLDYFPLDIDFDQDDKLSVVISKFGMNGLGIVVKIMMEIYRNGYFYLWGEREQYVFSNRINADINTVNGVIDECIKWGFFHQELYKNFGILTSRGFQKRFIEAAKRRKVITLHEDYILVNPEEESEKVSHSIAVVNDDGKIVNAYINPNKRDKADAEIPQSKVKESKVKKSKVINNNAPSDLKPNPKESPSKNSNSAKKGTKKPNYEEDSPYFKMAVYFKDKIDDMAAKEGLSSLTASTNIQTWANDFRLMVEVDKHSDKDLIRKVMDWVVTDHFWKSNVLSASKFRTQFPKLVLEMNKKTRTTYGAKVKPLIPVVQPQIPESTISDLSENEFEEMMRFAREMQESKGSR
ncbi:hypothetical protein E6C60_1989 [Paenibacillus algicola]|uniref:Lin1244/Lin1753-like N-terminal domain-containing protein n=1 Tax=Paenibacillus algicola TaxID=2565926 RepID=A0A4V1G3X4_9BACL|nr:DUF4373 domain-containing protein [Paenibacillus algicola]QCT02704.1 hypothetical protein E6C60_1989 [Paenibacillus algicola]